MTSVPQPPSSGAAPGPSSAAYGVHDLRDHDAAASEETPLLMSSASSISSRTYSLYSPKTTTTAGHVEDADTTQPRPPIRPARALAITCSLGLLIFLQASNMSGMTLIQGTVAAELGAYEASAMWFSSAYMIPMSSLTPIGGRLATIFPTRTLVLPVATLMAAGSLLCASANSFAEFVAGRIVAGVGAAGVMTLAVVLTLELPSDKTRGIVMGLINAGFTLGVSFGAVVYGGLMPLVGWRPLFWAQVPFAFVAGLGVYNSLPCSLDSRETPKGSIREKLARIDYLGAILLTTTIVLFLYGLADKIQILPLILSLITLIFFLIVEYYLATDPVIPIKVLSSRGILLSCLAQTGFMSARWSVLFYAPIFMLAVRGAAPAAAGSILIPTNIGFGLGGVLVGWLHVRRSGAFWLPSMASLALFSLSLCALSLAGTAELPVVVFILVVFVNGMATGGVLNYTLAHTLHLSHDDTQYIATSLIATFRGFGGSFGTAIGGGIFYRLLRSDLVSGFLQLDGGDELSHDQQRLVSNLLSSPGLVHGGDLSIAEREIAIQGYAGASRGVWQAAAVLGLVVVAIQAATGWTSPSEEEETSARGMDSENEHVGEAWL
ncbi:MFS domain-containing protein [Fusarium falciforme]|uniref:MFS domain-containing protein n=1 Tax=Fusarium falciforme TaxID=195108 RepID=UPI002301099D|nr:MFS domain-containing protein [Fusarium falciforme]WAO89384.1 MFS domain-containing protein [Fusarium falciforme]